MLRVKCKMCNATVNICNRRRKIFRNIILLLRFLSSKCLKRRSERYIEKRLYGSSLFIIQNMSMDISIKYNMNSTARMTYDVDDV